MTAAVPPPEYPAEWEADVVLRDGSIAHIRPIVPSDREGLRRFHAGQSEESIYLRFFAPLKDLSERDLSRFTEVDYVRRVALVATVRDELVGVGRYEDVDGERAEVAFNISDRMQGKGIGSVLLEHLTAIAQERGYRHFVADVLPQNHKMMGVFSDAGYEVSKHYEDGVVNLTFDISPTAKSEAVRTAREHRAEALSMRAVISPTSVALVGASRRDASMGRLVLDALVSGGFTGRLFIVHRDVEELAGVATVPSLKAIGQRVDLVVVCVPAHDVLAVVDEAAEIGARALLIVSSGFAEEGRDGAKLQRKLLKRARRAGMRLVGPNSFGLVNNADDVRLNATLTARVPPIGGLGLFAQSGALGIAVLATAARRNLGISIFASSGNRVDVSGNDFMQYWIDDPATTVVGLYLESMGNPRKFSRIARQLAAAKPVIVVMAAFPGDAGPPGHQTRRSSASAQAFAALLEQAGVIGVANLHALFDVAQLVAHQPIPAGPRVAVVGNSAALATIAVESCQALGLSVPGGARHVPATASVEDFRALLEQAFADPGVDSVLATFIPPLLPYEQDLVRLVGEMAAAAAKPCVATLLGMRGVDGGTRVLQTDHEYDGPGLPVYSIPEDAVVALAAATGYGLWLRRNRGLVVAPEGIDRTAAEAMVKALLAEHPEGLLLGQDDAHRLLAAYGINLWQRRPVTTPARAVAAAAELGYPVVLKATDSSVRRTNAVAGIRVDLDSAKAVRAAFASLRERLGRPATEELVVQRMAPTGVACVIGTNEDPLVGPVIRFSVAGPPTDLLDDIGYRVPPLTELDVSELVDSVKAAPLLSGFGATQPVDRAALEDVIARLSVLAEDLPEAVSVVLDPVMAHPDGVDVLGAWITLRPVAPRTDLARRALPAAAEAQ